MTRGSHIQNKKIKKESRDACGEDFLNQIYRKIEFAIEVEEEQQLPFLDILLIEKGDRTLRQLRNLHKQIHQRAVTPPTGTTIRNSENIGTQIRNINLRSPLNKRETQHHHYSIQEWIQSKNHNQDIHPRRNKNTEENNEEKTVISPNVKGTTHKIKNILGKENSKSVFRTEKTFRQI